METDPVGPDRTLICAEAVDKVADVGVSAFAVGGVAIKVNGEIPAVVILLIMRHRKSELLHIVDAGHTFGTLTRLRESRHQNCCKYGNDGDYYKKLNEGEGSS